VICSFLTIEITKIVVIIIVENKTLFPSKKVFRVDTISENQLDKHFEFIWLSLTSISIETDSEG
jgi:hypothetical protein